MKVPGRVFIFRRVAAAHVPAREAQPQVHPGIAHFEALFATARVRLHRPNLIQMCASCHAHVPASMEDNQVAPNSATWMHERVPELRLGGRGGPSLGLLEEPTRHKLRRAWAVLSSIRQV